ncbi:hypothetical protein IC229_22680 [Spirosoma sp. BT702]|uniref:Uncharacterized protein n=1 Tax=Spirosoma profusum TaxID=2771354 RepID=A0A927AS83_9BACT|nr:hypothetical protein [Spirosoma profusum]MBD2703468.1 hypothetical protein [Spirosoma profusum]
MSLRLYSSLAGYVTWFILSACQPSTTEPTSTANDYVLFEKGHYVIYDVQEERYGLNASPIQQQYQRKEVIGNPYKDVTGKTAYRLLRYRRSGESQSWQLDSIWSVRMINNEVIRTENGLDFITLLLPVRNESSWDGNRRNALGADTFTARNVTGDFYVHGNRFDNTVTVVEHDDSTLVSQDKRISVYARQVGLIYRERTQLWFCSTTPACIGRNQIDYGTRQIYRIRAYGYE